MTSLIQQLHESGEVKKNGCVLIVKNGRYHMSKGTSVHSIDVECALSHQPAAVRAKPVGEA